MNNLTSWMQQAKEVTKKFSEMMYIPAEDNDEDDPGRTAAVLPGENESTNPVSEEAKNPVKLSETDEVENKENIDATATDLPAVESNGQNLLSGFNWGTSEANAAATVEAAKKYANSFFSLAKEATVKAAATAEETAKKLQNVVTEKTIIGNLDKEQAKFNEEVNANKLTLGTLPWSDLPDQWIAKKHILALSLDTRNFIRDPPSETNFDFAKVQSIAAALLEEDPNLRKIRFQLVPKQLSEERFWRNYFYRIALVRQSSLGESGLTVASEDPICSKDIRKQDKKLSNSENREVAEKMKQENANKSEGENSPKTGKKDDHHHQQQEDEMDDDDSETKNEKLKEIRETVASAAQKKTEDDWEKDLVNDFNDYELVTGQMDKTDEQWEEEIAELLDSA